MASGSFTGSTSNNYITPRILWSSTPNTTANTSDITVTFQLHKSSASSSTTYGTGSWILNINGVEYKFNKYLSIPANNTYITAYTQTVKGIAHNTDGTKSVSISVTGGISGTSYTTTTISGTATLDKIARASSFNVASSMNTGSSLSVTIVPANSTFRHKVQLIIDGTAKYSGDYIAAGTNSISYDIPHSWLPSSTSKPMIVRLFTYTSTGTTAIGQVDKTVTVNVPDTVKPNISKLEATINSGGLSGNYVQGKSTVKLTCSATFNGGATVASYVFSGPNLSANSTSNTATSSVITSSGTLRYKVKVTDSRNRYAETTVDINVYPYAAPKITSIKAQRCLSDGTLDNNGTYARVTVTTAHSAISTANTAKVNLYNSKDNNFGTATQIISSTSASNTYDKVYGSGFLATTSYTIRATITDAYGATHTMDTTLASAQRAINIARYGNGVSVGGFSTVTSSTATGKFECHWDSDFKKGINVTGGISVAGGISSPTGVSTDKFSSLTGYNYLNGVDLNTITYAGTYGCLNCTNRPADSQTYGILEVIMYTSQWLIQRYSSISSIGTTGQIYERVYYGGTTWTNWTAPHAALKDTNGYQKLPSGIILAWGSYTFTQTATQYVSATVTFPITFPNKIVFAAGQNETRALHRVDIFPNTERSGATMYLSMANGSNLAANSQASCRYFIVGY